MSDDIKTSKYTDISKSKKIKSVQSDFRFRKT